MSCFMQSAKMPLIEVNISEWASFARGKGFNEHIITFIEKYPEVLKEGGLTLKGAETISQILEANFDMKILKVLISGTVGSDEIAERIIAHKLTN